MLRALILDDDIAARKAIRRLLGRRLAPIEIVDVGTATEAIAAAKLSVFDLAFLDLRLRGEESGGFRAAEEIRKQGRNTGVVIVSEVRDGASVRRAFRLGAVDYVFKSEIGTDARFATLLENVRGSKAGVRHEAELVGSSPTMLTIRDFVSRVADSDVPVLILGEHGAGKQAIAAAIHSSSTRRHEPLCPVRCSMGVGSVVEGELVAAISSVGRGTLLLHHVGALPVRAQGTLLRALATRTLPARSDSLLSFRGRIVATSVTALESQVSLGTFRKDLFAHLCVAHVVVPGLGGHSEDVRALAAHFALHARRRVTFTHDALVWLDGQEWPGNVRELRNFVERVSLLAKEATLDSRALGELRDDRVRFTASSGPSGDPYRRVAVGILSLQCGEGSRFERLQSAVLAEAMSLAGGVVSEAARIVGIDRKTFTRRLARLKREEASGT